MTMQLDKRVPLGTIIQIGVFVVMLGAAYGDIRATQDSIRGMVRLQEIQMESLRDDYVSKNVHAAEDRFLMAKFDEMSKRLERIEKLLDKR